MYELIDYIKSKHTLVVKTPPNDNINTDDIDYACNLENILKEYKNPLIWYFNRKENNVVWQFNKYPSSLSPSFFIFYKKETEYFIDIGYFYELVYDDCKKLEYKFENPIKLGKSNEIKIVYKNLVKKICDFGFSLYIDYYLLNNTEILYNIISKLTVNIEQYYIFYINKQIIIGNIEDKYTFVSEKQQIRLFKEAIKMNIENGMHKELNDIIDGDDDDDDEDGDDDDDDEDDDDEDDDDTKQFSFTTNNAYLESKTINKYKSDIPKSDTFSFDGHLVIPIIKKETFDINGSIQAINGYAIESSIINIPEIIIIKETNEYAIESSIKVQETTLEEFEENRLKFEAFCNKTKNKNEN